MAPKSRLSPDQLAQLRREYAAGSTYVELAERYGLSKSGVCWHLRGQGTRTQPLTDEQQARAIAAYRSGQSLRTVAVAFGVSKDYVGALVRRAGVERGQEAASRVSRGAPDPYHRCQPADEHALRGGRWVRRGAIRVWEPTPSTQAVAS